MLSAIWLGLWLAPLEFAQSTTPPGSARSR